MLTIIPLHDQESLNTINTSSHMNCEFAYHAKQNGETIGYCLYDYKDEVLYIEHIFTQSQDDNLVDGLVRAVLNSALNKGVNKAYFYPDIIPTLKDLGILFEETNFLPSISSFFSRGCNS